MPAYTYFHSVGRVNVADELPANVADMMVLRVGQIGNHYAEILRVNGPSYRPYLAVKGAPANLFIYEFESTEAMSNNDVERTWSTNGVKEISVIVKHDKNSKVRYRQI